MFVYCNRCKWSQDDFWSEDGYNPFDFMCRQGDKKLLFSGKLDEVMQVEKYDKHLGFIGYEHITNREFLMRMVSKWVEKIKNQRYITLEQYKRENPERKCPDCGFELSED